jgi:hypothetical protein
VTAIVSFIIPVRHQQNAKDWGALSARLTQTLRSVAAQESPNWRGVVVVNHGAELPAMPDKFEVVRVDFPPNPMHERGGGDQETFYDAFRVDKGRRVLAGMLARRETHFFMIVDDDDFVSRKIVGFASGHIGKEGWKINKGYEWTEGSSMVHQNDNFNEFCGTSLIINSTLYELPRTFTDATEDYVKNMLGSHIRIADVLECKGTPLAPLPFRGAIYRLGHLGAHSGSSGVVKHYLLNREAWRRPRRWMRELSRFRPLSRAIRDEFFG